MLLRRKKGEFMGDYFLGQNVTQIIKDENGKIIKEIETEIMGIDLDSFNVGELKYNKETIEKINKIIEQEKDILDEKLLKDWNILNTAIIHGTIKKDNLQQKAMYEYIDIILKEHEITKKEIHDFAWYVINKEINPIGLVKSNSSYAKKIKDLKHVNNKVIFYGNRNTFVEWVDLKELRI